MFILIAVILSNIMSANVAFEYCNMLWGIKYAGYSAPANVAFLIAIPYAIGIMICIAISYILRKKTKSINVEAVLLQSKEEGIVVSKNKAIFHIDKNNIIHFVSIVPAGVLELVVKQSEGYAYIKP